MKREAALRKSWKADLLIRFAIFIRIRKDLFLVVPIVSEPVRRIQDGESTTSWYPPALREYLKDAVIHTEIVGSDHCPVELDTEQL